MKQLKTYTFRCVLKNKEKIEQDFTVTMKSVGQVTAKDDLETMLTNDYGWITQRTYRNEDMKSERYWEVSLEHIDMPERD